MNLFVYGTLMDEEIGRLAGLGRYERAPALLRDFSRKRVKNECYPGLIEEEESEVPGIVYLEVDEEDAGRLDRFEGDEYERIGVTAFLEGGGALDCETYLFKHRHRHRLSDERWELEPFLKEGKQRFIDGYRGWNETR